MPDKPPLGRGGNPSRGARPDPGEGSGRLIPMLSVGHARRVSSLLLAAVVALALAATPIASNRARALSTELPGLSALLATGDLTTIRRGIATFAAVPTAAQASALATAGLDVQRLKQLPLALVSGPVGAMQTAVTTGAAA